MKVAYGITHDPKTGESLKRLPRTVKVSIGIPAGKDIHACYHDDGKGAPWLITVAGQNKRFRTADEARRFYREAVKNAPEKKHPSKLPYFTFRKMGPDGVLEPDWQAIEAHGTLPTVLDVLLTSDDAFEAEYQMWGAGRLKCHGDGINAMRAIDLASTPQEKALAGEAKEKGEKWFPIANGCKLAGCPCAAGDKPACKGHGALAFQLVKDIRLGGNAEYRTTGYRSISQLHSSIEELDTIVHFMTNGTRSAKQGVPLQLVLQPYNVTHNGKASRAYAVSLQLRAETLQTLREKVFSAVLAAGSGGPKVLPPAGTEAAVPDPEDATEEEAEAIAAEFLDPEDQQMMDDDFDDAPQTESQEAAAATAAKTAELRERLKQQQPPPVETAPPPAETKATTPAAPPAAGGRKPLF